MGCTSCSSGADGQPKGCKNNGTCGSDGCNKLTVFDWLSNMSLPGDQKPFIGVEVRFKNGRKHFYKNLENLSYQLEILLLLRQCPGMILELLLLPVNW